MPAERIPQSVTKRVAFQAYLSSDHLSPATGKTIAITISKNGAAYGNPSGGATNATEIGNGSYYVDLSTTDTGTAGPLFILGSVATVDPVNIQFDVVNAHNAGFDGLPNAVAGAANGVLINGVNSGGMTLSDVTISDLIISSVNVLTDFQIGGGFGCIGNFEIGGGFSVFANVLFSSNFSVAGNVHILGSFTIDLDWAVGGDFGVGGATTLTGAFTASNASNFINLGTSALTNAVYAADTGKKTIRSNTATAGSATTITLDASASSVTDFYKNCLIYITGGTGVGQARFCTAYNGTTKVATVGVPWVTNPAAASTFAILPWDMMACSSTGTGPKAVTIHTTDATPVALGGVSVTVQDPNDITVASGVTNGSGDLVVSLLASTQYTINTFKTGYTSSPSVQTTSAGNGAQTLTTIVLTAIPVPPPPVDPMLQTVYGTLYGLNGPAENAIVKFTLVPQNQNRPLTANGNVITFQTATATTDSNGFFTIDLPRSDLMDDPAFYNILCTEAQIDLEGVTLGAAPVDISDL